MGSKPHLKGVVYCISSLSLEALVIRLSIFHKLLSDNQKHSHSIAKLNLGYIHHTPNMYSHPITCSVHSKYILLYALYIIIAHTYNLEQLPTFKKLLKKIIEKVYR